MAAAKLTEAQLRAALCEKIETCAKVIGHQEKNDKNTHSGYKFTSNEQIMGVIRVMLIKHRIGLTCDIVDYVEREYIGKDRSGNDRLTIRSIVKIEVTITDLDTGFCIVSKGVGAEQDTQGKSMQQAITQAFKYWIFKNFKVSSSLEKDPDEKTTEVDVSELAFIEVDRCKTEEELKAVWKKYGKISDTFVFAVKNKAKNLMK